MAVTLNMSPTTNTLAHNIQFMNAGVNVGNLAPGAASVFTCTFDQVWLVVIPPGINNQITPGNFATNPGDIAIIQTPPAGGAGVDVCYAPANGAQTRVHFQ